MFINPALKSPLSLTHKVYLKDPFFIIVTNQRGKADFEAMM